MKTIFSKIIFLTAVLILNPGQTALPFNATENETEIIVIGTIHDGTDRYNTDTLLNILEGIKPDVILVECDSSYMTQDYQLKDDVKYSFLETRAITRYLRKNEVLLRPYDINDRDTFLNDRVRKRTEREFFTELYFLSQEHKLNDEAIDMMNRILSMMNTSELIANSPASYINSAEGSERIDTINFYTYSGLKKLISLSPELSKYRSYWERESDYWYTRNDVMIENILKYKDQFIGKKIVVLCGLSHKNLLKNGLMKKAKPEKIKVSEYWEKI